MSKILIVDLHNTVYDELGEYGPSLDRAVDLMLAHADKKGGDLDVALIKPFVHRQLRDAHKALGDDWDNRAFDAEFLPLMRDLFKTGKSYNAAKKKAIKARYEYSKDYIQNHAYAGAVDFLKQAQAQGHKVYIVTDATEQAVHPALKWLGLDGEIAGAYCCASPHAQDMPEAYRLERTDVRVFAQGRVKPDALIVAQIALDVAKEEGLVPARVKIEDVFGTETSDHAPLFRGRPAYVHKKLIVKDTQYRPLLQSILHETIGVGDDNRDLVMHLNAGIFSVKADYSANVPGFSVRQIKFLQDMGKAILGATSGWSEERLTLFSAIKKDAGLSQKLSSHLKYETIRSLPELAKHIGGAFAPKIDSNIDGILSL